MCSKDIQYADYKNNNLLDILMSSFCSSIIQMGTCIKRLFWPPPMKSKNRSCFSQVSSNWFIRTIAKVLKSGIDSTRTVNMVTKMIHQNRKKIG